MEIKYTLEVEIIDLNTMMFTININDYEDYFYINYDRERTSVLEMRDIIKDITAEILGIKGHNDYFNVFDFFNISKTKLIKKFKMLENIKIDLKELLKDE